MKLISEEAINVEFLTEATKSGGKNYFIEGIFMQANKKNRNGRVYPTEILQKEAEDANKKKDLERAREKASRETDAYRGMEKSRPARN